MPKLSKKKEAELLQQQRESRIRAALHWTEPAAGPDVGIPDDYKTLVTGYTFNAYAMQVYEACTTEFFHAVGRTDRVEAQGPLRLYSTRLLALRALRNAVERECAERLAKIDQMIEDATPARKG